MTKGYEQLERSVIFEGRILDLVDDRVRIPTGQEVHRYTVEHPGAVVILPVQNDGSILLVDQYRHSIRDMLLELPAGTLEKGEDPLSCAKRELIEETGFAAKAWTSLGIQYPLPGYCAEIQHAFFASDLSPEHAEGDDDEIIEVVSMTQENFTQALADGKITDGKTMALYARAKAMGLL